MDYQSYYQQPQTNYYPQQLNRSRGFIDVRNEQEARNYPIAPGNGLRFHNINEPYIYEKIMGFSQFEQPTFTKYRLVREDEQSQQEQAIEQPAYATLDDISDLRNEIKNLQNRLNNMNRSDRYEKD